MILYPIIVRSLEEWLLDTKIFLEDKALFVISPVKSVFCIAGLCVIESFSFAKSDPQVKITVIKITLTTIIKIVAIKGETDLLFRNIINKKEEKV